jgi:hypothetical protein
VTIESPRSIRTEEGNEHEKYNNYTHICLFFCPGFSSNPRSFTDR